jgi:hypothetical protein
MPREPVFKQDPCADVNGFSPHAAVLRGADERPALEQLCRYIARPALANERVQCDAAGHVALKLKTPWHGGTTQVLTSPLGFMQRLAGLVPRPRLPFCSPASRPRMAASRQRIAFACSSALGQPA